MSVTPENSSRYYLLAIKHFIESRNIERTRHIYPQVSRHLASIADYKGWEQLAHQILDFLDSSDDEFSCQLMTDIGYSLVMQGKPSQALSTFEQIQRTCKALENEAIQATVFWGIAEAQRFMDLYDKALSTYTSAQRLFEKLGIDSGIAETLWGIAESQRFLGQYNLAANNFSASLEYCQRANREDIRLRSLLGLADIHRRTYQWDKAIDEYCYRPRSLIAIRPISSE